MADKSNDRSADERNAVRKLRNKYRKSSFHKKIKYHVDSYMARGVVAQFFLLLGATIVIIFIFGLLLSMSPNYSSGNSIWQSFAHLIDPGTFTGDDPGDPIEYLLLMGVITVIGLIILSVLIGIIENGISDELSRLSEGHSEIMEKDHVVILGFDNNIHCILEELVYSSIEASADSGNHVSCIVIADDQDKSEIERQLAADIRKFKTLKGHPKIIVRSVDVTLESTLEMLSLKTAKSVIVNYDDDFTVIRVLLAVSAYLEKADNYIFDNNADSPKGEFICCPDIVTLLHKERSINAAQIATAKEIEAGHCEIMFFEDIIARIIAQVCRQPGLSNVLTEIFSYKGSEIYFIDNPLFGKEGSRFSDLVNYYENAVVLGLIDPDRCDAQSEEKELHKTGIWLNPDSEDQKILPVSQVRKIVVLAENDNQLRPYHDSKKLIDNNDGIRIQKNFINNLSCVHMLILDWNVAIDDILRNMNDFVAPGSTAIIASDREYDLDDLDENYSNITVDSKVLDIFDKDKMKELLHEDITNVLLVCDDEAEPEQADAKTAMLLLHLRSVVDEKQQSRKRENIQKSITITSEMNLVQDQRLLRKTNINDFIVGSELANRIMAQVSNNLKLHDVYHEILDAEGSEIFLHPVSNYLDIEEGESVNITFARLAEIVGLKEQIALGWQKYSESDPEGCIRINPGKAETVSLDRNDKIVVLAKLEDNFKNQGGNPR